MAERKLDLEERARQGFRLALDVLQTEADSEPHDPEAEVTVDAEVWARFVALARQMESGARGKSIAGICRVCGCTWLAGCLQAGHVGRGGMPDTCSWADRSMTLCSACKPRKGRARR